MSIYFLSFAHSESVTLHEVEPGSTQPLRSFPQLARCSDDELRVLMETEDCRWQQQSAVYFERVRLPKSQIVRLRVSDLAQPATAPLLSQA